ncbi:LacI family DNA-binding transcriptional regulator [Pedobacter rhodius]|uniref:LacI family DNA-binding transcriptional regulator n=1 Tax=Pedobacter rhodius TaxID=3004098 RepID=A0ABT4KRX8_9SPHI|nr:LacI family DNA-binding transcriptional regulator [Pedobacter sp. SJ11]MCZ4221677.1 LacI family DNA-binding transcriptional regulator [Pedobacter sp. SJ11]
MKKTTIYDIAKALNVTVSTVSRALSGFPAISDSTRKAVIETAKQLNYSPNKLASALKSGKTYTIGVIVPSVEAHFFATIIDSIEEGLKDAGYRIIVYQSKESLTKEIDGVKALTEAQVDGIIASMSLETNNVSHFEAFINQDKPLILFDRINMALEVPTITLNDFRAGFIATEHLLVNGYQNIVFVTTTHQIKIFENRLKGYKAALEANGLPVNEDNILFGGLSIADGKTIGTQLLKRKKRPDAIIAGDDFTALGIMQQLKSAGITPPEIGIIGFANETFSEYVTPSLTTVEQYPANMGKACAEMFLDMIRSLKPYENIKHFVIEPVVIARGSTAKK